MIKTDSLILLVLHHAGYTLHSAIHQARRDLKCVIHLHTPAVVSVSAMKCGLLPLSQEALACGKISYHDYHGILIEQEIKKILVKDLGPTNKVMILRNHGFVACGETIEEAWYYAFNLINASEIQARAGLVGIDQLYLQSSEKDTEVADILRGNTKGTFNAKQWEKGQLEFECLMRMLDDAGYCTGYLYHQPLTYATEKTMAMTTVEGT
ncbi:unnamed protein product [Rotaria magnacalcarata]|uniref:Class II aldolase/adducin N-terminal domain-containing protein n=1 Tax=Rotaria magnacalcarata TaxID=392030 RepID=A0A816LTN8_9BILA|nr:unnamed protein product [Rotaria magnacalcarata]